MLIKDGNQPDGLGYLLIDQRASGLPVGVGGSAVFESDTYTCKHCCAVVLMEPMRKRERYRCKSCHQHICDGCAANVAAGGSCLPMQQRIEEDLERQAYLAVSQILP